MENNEKKYGKKENDIISMSFQVDNFAGAAFCFCNILKYVKRYKSDSEKKELQSDIFKILDYANRLVEMEIITPAQYISVETLLESKQFNRFFEFIHILLINYSNVRKQEIFHEQFEKLLARNYKSVTECRKLITAETSKQDFIDKIKEEVDEFDYEFLNAKDLNSKAAIECVDIILSCLNCLKHYNINILDFVFEKISINEKR